MVDVNSLYYQMPTRYQYEAWKNDGLVVSPSGEIFSEAGIISSPALNVIAKDQATQMLIDTYEHQNQFSLNQALQDAGIDTSKPTSQTGTVATIIPKKVAPTNPTIIPNDSSVAPGVSIAEAGSPLNMKWVLIGGLGIFLMLFIFKR
jgi:hypothetical protein